MKKAADERVRELYRINGKLTADIVIQDAKNPDSPLHDEFEWNIEKAAMEAWRETARRIIRSVNVVITTESRKFSAKGYRPPEFVRDPSSGSKEQGYVRVHDIRNNKDRARAALSYEIERINGCLCRARALCDELGLQYEISIVEDAVQVLRKKTTGKPASD